MAKRDKRGRRKDGGRFRVPTVALEVVPLPGPTEAEACALCGRVGPLRHVVAGRGGPGDADVLGALAVCDEHAGPAARFLARAFALVLGPAPGGGSV